MLALDSTDVQILQLLVMDGRMPNSALAARVGIAPSTCLGRVRSLRERGILRGFGADIDPAALGYPIQAMVSVKMQPHARDQLTAFMRDLLDLPLVLNAYLLGGSSDFLIHVAAESVERLRELVIDELNTDPAVAATETNLIFQYRRAGRSPVGPEPPVRSGPDGRGRTFHGRGTVVAPSRRRMLDRKCPTEICGEHLSSFEYSSLTSELTRTTANSSRLGGLK